MKTAQRLGHGRQVTYLLAILAVVDGHSFAQVAVMLHVHEKTVATWVRLLCCYGLQGAPPQKPPGCPPKHTPTQKAALATLIDAGPSQAGCSGACGRSPMIQQLIDARFGVFYNGFSIAQLLKNLGFSFPKAACISDHLDEAKRQAWRTATWQPILRRAKTRKALLLLGDAASFPQWGTLTYTGARRGQHPKVKTCGTRQGSNVFGLIDSFTGHFLYQGQAGRLNSSAAIAFLPRVLAHTTHPIILIQDGAKYHTSVETKAFFAQQTARLEVVQLPAYSPDYNPMEKLWKKSKQQETHLHYFPTFEALTAKVEQALLKFTNAPEAILALCSLPTALAQAASVHLSNKLFLECYRRGAHITPQRDSDRIGPQRC